MLVESFIAVLFLIFIFILGIVALFGWIIEGDRLDKERERNEHLVKENKQLKELNNELDKKIIFLELQLELEKNKQDFDAEPEESEGAA